jgi:hypothetical protein
MNRPASALPVPTKPQTAQEALSGLLWVAGPGGPA